LTTDPHGLKVAERFVKANVDTLLDGMVHAQGEGLDALMSSFSGVIADEYHQVQALGANLRIIEVNRGIDLVHRLNQIRHRYGPISYVHLSTHTSKNAMTLGCGIENGQSYEYHVTKEWLKMQGARALKRAFVKDPVVIIDGCWTGMDDGIAQVMSELGAAVFSSRYKSAVESLTLGKSESGHVIPSEVHFLRPHHLRLYKDGQRLK